jgi:hypothetical protein
LGLAADAKAGLVHVLDGCGGDAVAHRSDEILQVGGAAATDPRYGRSGDPDAEQFGHQFGQAIFRQQLIVQQIGHNGGNPRAILHGRVDAERKPGAAVRAAGGPDRAKFELIARYVREYNDCMYSLAGRLPEKVMLVKTEELNDATVQKAIFDFIGMHGFVAKAQLNVGTIADGEILNAEALCTISAVWETPKSVRCRRRGNRAGRSQSRAPKRRYTLFSWEEWTQPHPSSTGQPAGDRATCVAPARQAVSQAGVVLINLHKLPSRRCQKHGSGGDRLEAFDQAIFLLVDGTAIEVIGAEQLKVERDFLARSGR